MGITKFKAPAGKAKGIGLLVSHPGTTKIVTKWPAGPSEGTAYSSAMKEGRILEITDSEQQAYELQKREEEEERKKSEEAKKKLPPSETPSHVNTRSKAAKPLTVKSLPAEPVTARSKTLVEKVVDAILHTQQQLSTPNLSEPEHTT